MANTERTDEIARLLKHGNGSTDFDKAAFTQWANHDLTLKECIGKFKKNNDIPKETYIDEWVFQAWLKEIGYWRDGEV